MSIESATGDDVDILREGYQAFSRGDVPAVLGVLHPDIEWVEPEGYPWGGTFRGHEEVVGLFGTAAERLGPEWRVEPDRFVATEDGVLVLGSHRGHGPAGPWAVPFAMVWEMEDGLVAPLTRISPHLLTESPQVSTRWRGQGSG